MSICFGPKPLTTKPADLAIPGIVLFSTHVGKIHCFRKLFVFLLQRYICVRLIHSFSLLFWLELTLSSTAVMWQSWRVVDGGWG